MYWELALLAPGRQEGWKDRVKADAVYEAGVPAQRSHAPVRGVIPHPDNLGLVPSRGWKQTLMAAPPCPCSVAMDRCFL